MLTDTAKSVEWDIAYIYLPQLQSGKQSYSVRSEYRAFMHNAPSYTNTRAYKHTFVSVNCIIFVTIDYCFQFNDDFYLNHKFCPHPTNGARESERK